MLLKKDLPPDDHMPNYWDLLNQEELNDYLELKKYFTAHPRISKKEKQDDVFRQKLDKIRSFIGDEGDRSGIRSLVCGLAFLSESIAINIQQLTVLLGKCKSSINGSLQSMNYVSLSPGNRHEAELAAKIPFEHLDKRESKKWTIRESRKVNAVRGQFPSIMTFFVTDEERALFAPREGEESFIPGGVDGLAVRLGAQLKPRMRGLWDIRGMNRIQA